MTPRQLVSRMRVRTFDYVPFLSTYIYTLTPREKPGVGTMCVDKHGNMYFDPEFVTTLTLDSGAYVIAHESLHLVLRHHARSRELYGESPTELQQFVANVAADLVVEQALACMRRFRPANAIHLGCNVEKIGMTLDFPDGLRQEEYYRLIMDTLQDKADKQQGQGGQDGDDKQQEQGKGDGEDDPIAGGSCADGVPRDYEDTPDGSWEAFGEHQAAASAEKAISELEKSQPGSVPGCIKEAVGCVLRVKRDPWKELRAAVATSVSSPVGGRQASYRRLPRKYIPGPVLRKGYKRTAPKAVVILDTSYSMLDNDIKDMAIACIASGLRKLARFKVIAGDTEIHSRKQVTNIRQIEWVGGGGTAMDRLVQEVDESEQPDSIVIVTDCETRWPDRATHARLVVASTSADEHYLSQVPSWARLVTLVD